MAKIKKDKKPNILARLLSDEKWQAITIPAFTIAASFIVASIIILIMGQNPLSAFKSMLQGSGILPKPKYSAYKNMLTDLMEMINALTPMIFAALAVAVALRAGLFNIGVSGQMLVSAFIATITIGYSDLSSVIAKPLVIIIGFLTGAIFGGIVGFLKYKFNINEVVSTIMFNHIIQYTTSYFINTRFVDQVSRQSKIISNASRLTFTKVELGNIKMDIPIFIVLAVILAFAIKFLLNKTVRGYEIKAVGLNTTASKYAGINVNQNIVLSMLISGGLAGLAGVTYYLGYYNSMIPKILPNLGFDSIAVSLLGNNNPVGILFSALLITVIDKGSIYMNSRVGIQQEISDLITSLILLFSACSTYIKFRAKKSSKKGGID